nr:MAG TPA: hypothetical protein [Bacteriophage sp.]
MSGSGEQNCMVLGNASLPWWGVVVIISDHHLSILGSSSVRLPFGPAQARYLLPCRRVEFRFRYSNP